MFCVVCSHKLVLAIATSVKFLKASAAAGLARPPPNRYKH